MSAADAKPELDRAEVLGVLVPACITRVYAEAPTFSSFANAFTIGKSPLRQACHDFQQLAEAGAEAGAMSAELVEIATRAFRLACDNKTSKLCDPALEGLRLLFATGLVQGATEGGRQSSTTPPRAIIVILYAVVGRHRTRTRALLPRRQRRQVRRGERLVHARRVRRVRPRGARVRRLRHQGDALAHSCVDQRCTSPSPRPPIAIASPLAKRSCA